MRIARLRERDIVTKVLNLDVLLAYNVPLHLLSKVKEVKVGGVKAKHKL